MEPEEIRMGEMFEGYRDGFADPRDEVTEGTNRSDAYVFGWRNGRDDRTGSPRATADVLRSLGSEIIAASPPLAEGQDGKGAAE